MNGTASAHTRIRFLMVASALMLAIFIVRLFWLQIVDHDKYVLMANEEQIKRLVIPAERGEIYAMDGQSPVKIVLNQAVYTVFADPMEVKEPETVVSTVKRIAGGNIVGDDLNELVRAKPSRYKVLATKVSRQQAELLRNEKLAGIGLQQTTKRVYPESGMAAQVLGFVNSEEKGQYGIEEELDNRLKGRDGLLESVTDVSNIPLTIGDKQINIPAQDGEDVVLTIDRNVQSYAESALKKGMDKIGAENGSALVMDPQTGEVLAMANYPTYNPDNFTTVKDTNAFNNSIINDPYEPASVMKIFTMATGIDRGVITPESTYVNTDSIQIEDITIQNASKGQTGTITMQHALNWSLNTGSVTVMERLGDGNNITRGARDIVYHYFHNKFRLDEPTGIELAGEVPGSIVPPTEVEGNAVRYSNMSFGQGLNLTMLEVASAFSAVVNGGDYHKPTVIAGSVDTDGNFKRSVLSEPTHVLNASTSQTVKQMVHDARAAFWAGKDKKGYDIGGKTGTAQTIINGKYDFSQTTATYIGYGGDTEPIYVIMVRVSAKGQAFDGGRHANPIFTDISNWMIDYKKLQPQG
ncbi:MAG: peptidoglycan D,D-transpeptidase FtsI family protein [Candidatus Saccharimonadales bacterium]